MQKFHFLCPSSICLYVRYPLDPTLGNPSQRRTSFSLPEDDGAAGERLAMWDADGGTGRLYVLMDAIRDVPGKRSLCWRGRGKINALQFLDCVVLRLEFTRKETFAYFSWTETRLRQRVPL